MAVAIHIVDGIFNYEALFQGGLYGRDVEGQIEGDIIVPLVDDGAVVVVLECGYEFDDELVGREDFRGVEVGNAIVHVVEDVEVVERHR